MNLQFHRVIILLLLVLQGFAPFVHAHVQTTDSVSDGIHIDEISRVWQESSDAASLSSRDHSSQVIDMQAAIQQKKLLLEGELLNAVFVDAEFKFTQLLCINKLIGFSPPVLLLKPPVSLSVIAPRAPPTL